MLRTAFHGSLAWADAAARGRRSAQHRIQRRCGMQIGFFLAWLMSASALAQSVEHRENWFNDPFFRLTDSLAKCPEPLGPFITEAERRVQAHHRAEKGTTCWLAGQCDKPNFYAYDQDIAAALRDAFSKHDPVEGPSSLWVLVQGRVVFIEGCAEDQSAAAALEQWARSIPNVLQAVAAVRTSPAARVPYKVKPGTH